MVKKFCFWFSVLTSLCLIFPWYPSCVFSSSVAFKDAYGNEIQIEQGPSRVVSLVPSVTEIIFKIGAGDAIKGITYFSTYPPETSQKTIVGGFFSPSLNIIEKMKPDVIFLAPLHKKIRERFNQEKYQLFTIETNAVSDSYNNILLLGKIFNQEAKAAGIVNEIKSQLQIVARKVEKIPKSKRKRVIRLMGRNQVMTPGDDSFQNELIRLSGGIPPMLNKKGNVVAITKEEWISFNPQIIYGCGADRETAERFFSDPVWKDVAAVKNGKVFYFPCELTCRASTNTGYFVSWLSARIYDDEFSRKENQVLEDRIFNSYDLDIDLEYIKHARIAHSYINDFLNKALIIDFKEPLSVVSTLEGWRDGIESIGNHYSPPPSWSITHKTGLDKIRARINKVIGKSKDTASFLFTGADMDHLVIKRKRFREMEIWACTTAGVASNAVRMSKNKGSFYEPGTINIIILPNMKLTPRAMTRAIISATEAKAAALMDLDIRSSATPCIYQATGTGTDNILVVEGTGPVLDNAGGHCKLGELIATAVYEAVQEAVYKQNSIVAERHIFQRLKERNISVFGLSAVDDCECNMDKGALVERLEKILLQPRYAAFIESSLALSDGYESGLITDLAAYEMWCKQIAQEIAGKKIEDMTDLVAINDLPIMLRMSLNARLNGVYHRTQ